MRLVKRLTLASRAPGVRRSVKIEKACCLTYIMCGLDCSALTLRLEVNSGR